MTSQSMLLLGAFLIVLLALSYPLGNYIVRIAADDALPGLGWLGRFEQGFYRLAGIV